jgi:DNA mismatch repair protein MutS
MLAQYRELKARHPGVLLLFRLGDFYELFEEDADVASKALELTLTGREMGRGHRVAMCGVPQHALDRYLPRLIRQGFRAAVVEQTEDPKLSKGLVARDVVRVISAGTVTEDVLLEQRANNYLVALADGPRAYALAVADISTGEFRYTEFNGDQALRALTEELERLAPAEILWPLDMQTAPAVRDTLAERLGAQVTAVESGDSARAPGRELLCRHFGVERLAAFGLEDRPLALAACATLLRYVHDTQRAAAGQLATLASYTTGETMILDAATRRNLELTLTLRDGQSGAGTLLWLLDATQTPMGARLLRGWLVRPLLRAPAVNARLDAVGALFDDVIGREDVRAELRKVSDLERLITKAVTGRALPRDLLALRESLRRLPALQVLLTDFTATRLAELAAAIADLGALVAELDAALHDEPPAQLKDGGTIRERYSPELDELRALASHGKGWIVELEAKERAATGIGNLKVGFNQVFGYYIEVTHAHRERVPERWIRKQTVANAERYISPELKEWEAKILGAEERLLALESRLFGELRARCAESAAPILASARAIAEVDVYAALAHVAAQRGYVRPTVDEGDVLHLREARHPIVEATRPDIPFVPNDTLLDTADSRLHIVTGPNMAGKSTYLRQVALITLMAQLGSFVPASEARIGTVDRIFTRVGAQDDLATGQSTFMVEMTETANILHNATRRSLVVLDEIGRGTSTHDGLAIAWAVVEYLHDHERSAAKTLFATHYHDLNALEGRLKHVRNYRVAVAEDQRGVHFLHRIEPGGTDRSYGIEVARLAGLPPWVIRRAQQILTSLEGSERGAVEVPAAAAYEPVQLALFAESVEEHPALLALRGLDVMRLTPIEAINRLFELQKMAQKET